MISVEDANSRRKKINSAGQPVSVDYAADREDLQVLEYFALGLLIFVALVFFYGVIAIHDIPYEIAVKRNHPHQDVLHVAVG